MIKKLRLLESTPPDLSGMPMYTEYFWYDGPLLYSVGTRSERYLFTALGDDDRSRATNTQPYLVVPMTSKREQDIFEDKLTLRQSVLHSGGKVFRTYDFGKTYEEVDLTSPDRESFLVEPGIRFSFRSFFRKYNRRKSRKN